MVSELLASAKLKVPEFDKPFAVVVEVTPDATVAMLMQFNDVLQTDMPVLFHARPSTKTELALPRSVSLVLAAAWAFRKFKLYLYGRITCLYMQDDLAIRMLLG